MGTTTIDIDGVPTPINTAISAAIATEGGGGPAFPVGSLFTAAVATNPATLLGYGTWAAWGEGRVFVCYKAGDADFGTLGAEGGAKTVTLTAAQMPVHTHTQNSHNHTQDAHAHTLPVGATDDTSAPFDRADAGSNTAGANASTSVGSTTATNQAATAVNQNAGGGEAHPNLVPFKVGYCWERTA